MPFNTVSSGCKVTLANSGVPAEWAERTLEGWVGILAKAKSGVLA